MEKWLLVGLVVSSLLIFLGINPSLSSDNPYSQQLESPLLLGVEAQAQEQGSGVNFLQQEAGIAAYAKGEESLDLAQVESAFKSVETASDSYIIGEVALSKLPEKAHPHVYVNQDGWVVAYYSKAEPASKMMQWVGYEGGKLQTTTLQNAIQSIFESLQRPYPEPQDVSYYNFKYPDANRVMIVTEMISSGGGETSDSFNLTVPEGAQIYEASWALRQRGGDNDSRSNITLDEEELGKIYRSGMIYDSFTSRIKKGFRHTIAVNRWDCGGADYCQAEIAATALIYQVTGE